MSLRLILVYWVLCCASVAADETTDSESEAHYQNASMLRGSFEKPLQLELLKSGLTSRNAQIAAQSMLNSLIDCWDSDRNKVTVAEQETMTVRLGGQTIITYKTPCMDEFLADVDEVAR